MPTTHRDNVLSIETEVSVALAQKPMSLSDVLRLAPGSLLVFDKRCTDSLSVEAGGQEIARATAVQVGDQLGVRIE